MKKINFIIYSVFVLLISLYAYNNPFYNWDTLGYVGCVLSADIDDKKTLHELTYQTVRDAIPSNKYQELVSGGIPFREQMSSGAEDFYEQLYVYRIKPLYILLIRIFVNFGFSVVDAIMMVSVVSIFFLCFLVYYWLSGYVSGVLLFFSSVGMVFIARLLYLARLATPDAFLTAILALAFFLLIEKKKVAGSLLLFFIAVLIRPDNAILAVMIPLYLYCFRFSGSVYHKSYMLILPVIPFVLLGLICMSISVNNWWMPFHRAFLGLSHNTVDFNAAFYVNEYFEKFAIGLILPFWDKSFFVTTPFFIVLGLIAMKIAANATDETKIFSHMNTIALIGIALHFILFPTFNDRYFIIYHLIIGMMSFIICLKKKAGVQ